jgi:hypothetical protein
MSRITIRRKKKKVVEPEPEKQPELAPAEVSESESFDSIEERYIDDVLDEAKEEICGPEPVSQPRYAPERRVHFREPAKPAQNHPRPVRQYPQPTPLAQLNDPYRRNHTMRQPPMARPKHRGREKFRYTTHYGMHGDVLDTQAKAGMLYKHCFG